MPSKCGDTQKTKYFRNSFYLFYLEYFLFVSSSHRLFMHRWNPIYVIRIVFSSSRLRSVEPKNIKLIFEMKMQINMSLCGGRLLFIHIGFHDLWSRFHSSVFSTSNFNLRRNLAEEWCTCVIRLRFAPWIQLKLIFSMGLSIQLNPTTPLQSIRSICCAASGSIITSSPLG